MIFCVVLENIRATFQDELGKIMKNTCVNIYSI